MTEPKPQHARPTVQEVLQQDPDTPPACLTGEHSETLDSFHIDKSVYTAPQQHALEMSQMWSRVWQMVCREEDLQSAGDHVVYDIGDTSLIVTRTPQDEIKAFYNSCLHRGRRLRDGDGWAERFRCAYHGFTWNTDGTLFEVPTPWDFSHIEGEEFRLPEAKVGTWAGFVFINMDLDCEPLEDYLGVLPEHFAQWDFHKRRKAAHVAKVIPCNWKVGLEAFLEGLHVAEVHPEALPYTGDINCQYDCWGPNISRMMSALATPSPRLGEAARSEQDTVDAMRGFVVGDVGELKVPANGSARQVMADALKEMLSNATGINHQDFSVSEVLDAIQYFAFPNFVPWAGYGVPIVYRFRPYGNDPDQCIMEVMLLYLGQAEGHQTPPEIRWLKPEEPWSAAEELGGLGPIFDQDAANFAAIQSGLKAGGAEALTLSSYQESRVRHYHQTLRAYLSE